MSKRYTGDNMMFNAGVWLVICYLCRLATGYCLYGDDPKCAFQCHCAKNSECSGGTCPSGCDTAPLGYNWRGPTCQIGNVGLHKPANMTAASDYYKLYPPKAALDGVSPGVTNANCAHPADPNNISAEWWTDLGDVYKIYNITIYGSNDPKLQQFVLTVYNTSDNEVSCGYHHDPVLTHSTITCTEPVIGRYVHFKKTGSPDITWTPICEVVIIGHKYIDCTGCPTGVSCSDVTGCTQCSGSYPPDCTTNCESGYYGTNCQQHCGHCKDGVTCDNQNGRCGNGCQMWWADDRCDKYIEKLNGTEKNISVKQKTESSIEIEWQHLTGISDVLKQYYGYLIQYKEETTGASYKQAVTVNYTSSPYWKFEKLKSYTSYSIQIKPFRMFANQKDYGSPYPVLQVNTSCGEPETPQITNVTLISEDKGLPMILVLWKDVSNIEAHCAYINNITLEYKLKNGNGFTSLYVDLNASDYTINRTEAGEYNIRLVVVNNEGLSSPSNFSYITVIGTSDKASDVKKFQGLKVIIAGAGTALILIVVIVVAVIMWRRRRRQIRRRPQKTEHDNQSFSVDNENYVGVSRDFANQQSRENNISKSRKIRDPESEPCDSDVNVEKEKDLNLNKDEPEDYDTQEITDEPDTEENLYANSAVAVASFEGYVARKMARPNELSDEFKLLAQPDFNRCKVAVTAENKDKNRYRNIYAYDENRVKLSGEEKDDYINASYITGFNKKNEYIATQGCKDITLIDFWRLVWQEKSNRIVVVTNIRERGKQKVHPYWPDEVGNSVTIGDFKIKTEVLETSADYRTRIMTVKRGDDYRTVHQFHFTTWEDKKKPVHGCYTILAFLNKIHSIDKFSQGPLIVHCSAGVGRTGTFIALDILIQMAVKDKSVDVFNTVQRLRHERMLMVQTLEQYIYLYEAVVEFIKSGNTSMDYVQFQTTFANILQSDPGTQIMKRIEKELKALKSLKKPNNNPKRDGLKSENKNKNRNKNIIPDDFHRLFLSRGNYINAVFVDRYKAHDAYIVTQMPLPHTISDFWQLILENRCQAIVMLNGMDPEDKTCLPYWPEAVNTKQKYGRIDVELVSVKEQDFIIIRDLKITEISTKKLGKSEELTLRQFQLLSWPRVGDLPPDRGHLLTLMEKLQYWQEQNQVPEEKWISLIHCIDGGSHSGMFCGASFMLERMKAEQSVDAFLAVRYVTRNRPEFFTKLHEYKFLYQMAMEYLKSHNDYYNVG